MVKLHHLLNINSHAEKQLIRNTVSTIEENLSFKDSSIFGKQFLIMLVKADVYLDPPFNPSIKVIMM